MGIEERRFTYTAVEAKTGEQTLRLAQKTPIQPRGAMWAENVADIDSFAGNEATISQSVVAIVPSPKNLRHAVLMDEASVKFEDHFLYVVNLQTGSIEYASSEHGLNISSSTFVSTAFEQYKTEQVAEGILSQAEADLLTWTGVVDSPQRTGPLPSPEVRWHDDETLVVRYLYTLAVSGSGVEFAEEHFTLRLTAAAGFNDIKQWTAPMPPPPPASVFTVEKADGIAGNLLYKGFPVRFVPSWLKFMWRFVVRQPQVGVAGGLTG